ncbi:MAG: UPF0175 family protein [Acidobacteria bacterium]|nr:UPF0175 family protein [Acidobacteriota bacterium]
MAFVLSDEELEAAHISEAEARLALALQLFQDDRVTLARAAGIAGLHQMDFQRELAQRKIPLHYDLEMLQEDLQHVARLKPL